MKFFGGTNHKKTTTKPEKTATKPQKKSKKTQNKNPKNPKNMRSRLFSECLTQDNQDNLPRYSEYLLIRKPYRFLSEQ
ncbi:hypothetical protein AM228_23070 [Planktothricoides sp. SR001]|nr:hypothetical protein AM228_23070 [Planktothricoides sp. SR001]